MIKEYIKLLRIPQWIKNIILFAGLIFGKKITDLKSVEMSLTAFVLFSLVASCQYILNDYLDRKEDALHPEKKSRPIASGKISPEFALYSIMIILPMVLVISFYFNRSFFFLVNFYLIFNITYSKFLKHIVILDVMSISIGFVIRAIIGAVVVNVQFSNWLLLCTFMLALFWGFSKRRGELVILDKNAGLHRKILDEYSKNFLDLMMGIVAAMTLMSYVMYSISSDTIEKLGTDKIIFTIPLVTYAIFRSLYIIYIKNMGHNPTKAILTDFNVIFTGLLWLITISTLMYFRF